MPLLNSAQMGAQQGQGIFSVHFGRVSANSLPDDFVTFEGHFTDSSNRHRWKDFVLYNIPA